MKDHMNLFVWSPLALLKLLLLSVFLLVLLIFFSQSGLRTVVEMADVFLPQLNVQGFQGRLNDKVAVTRLSWKNDELNAGIEQLQLSRLDTKKFEDDYYVDHLTASELSLDMADGTSLTVTGLSAKAVRFNQDAELRLDELNIKSVRVKLPNTEAKASVDEKTLNAEQSLEALAKQNWLVSSLLVAKNTHIDALVIEQGDQTLVSIKPLSVKGASVDEQQVKLEQLLLQGQIDAQPFTMSVTNAQVALLAPHDLQATIDFQWATSPQTTEERVSLEGQLQMSGHFNAIRLDADFAVDTQLGQQRIKAVAKGDTKKITIDPMNSQGDLGDIAATAEIINVLSGSPSWQLEGELKEFKTAAFAPQWPSVLNAKVLHKGEWPSASSEPRVSLEVSDIKGNVNGSQVTGNVSVSYNDKQQLLIDAMQLNSGDNHISAVGVASEPFDVKFDIDAPKIEQLLPGFSGDLKAKGEAQGKLDALKMNAVVNSKSLRYQQYQLKQLRVNAVATGGLFDVQADVGEVDAESAIIKQPKVTFKGSLEQHQLHLMMEKSDVEADILLSGGWAKDQWTGQLRRAKLNSEQSGLWQLSKPIAIKYSDTAYSVSPYCFVQKGSQLCGEAAWQSKQGYKLSGSAREVKLNLFNILLPEGYEVSGNATLDYNLRANHVSEPQGTFKLSASNSSVAIAVSDDDIKTVTFSRIAMSGRVDKGQLNLDTDVKADYDTTLKGKISLDVRPYAKPRRITGKLSALSPNVYWLQRFVPEVAGVSGRLESDLTLSGTIENPLLAWDGSLKNGEVKIPELGTQFTGIQLKTSSSGNGKSKITGVLRSGKGVLNLDATATVDLQRGISLKGKLTGKRFLLINTHEAKIYAEPDLNIEFNEGGVDLTGVLHIPEAQINLQDVPEFSISETDDVVVAGEEKAQDTTLFRPEIDMRLGQNVKFSGFGLNARLIGQMKVSEFQQEYTGNGTLKVVDGVYKAYGQDLQVNNGTLVFNGPFNNIGIDINAVREIEDESVKVGIRLQGTLLNPKSSLSSEPAGMVDSDILSYLLTGQSISDSSGSESAMLMSAVRSLGVAGGNGIMRRIGGSLGLDDLSLVGGESLEDSSLKLGKKIGSKFYVNYMVGLYDRMQKVAIEYKFNKKWKLQAESGVEQGIDLIYQTERD